MFIFCLVLLIAVFLSAVAGITALLCGSRYVSNRERLMRSSLVDTRIELKRVRTNAKHTRAHRQRHDRAEAAQFALIKLRDTLTLAEQFADNAAEHMSRVSGD